jgi:hypothetical protein
MDEGVDWDAPLWPGVESDAVDLLESDDGHESASARPRKAESEADKAKRRAVIAAASRATRAKRKREKEDLAERNVRLERDRDSFLATIADLQTEVQSLRDAGAINLAKENELLRTEISLHKQFILNIVSAARSVPSTTEEERFRVVKQGADSAVGQVIGLAFTSSADPSWLSSTLGVERGPGQARAQLPIKMQLLPLGSDLSSFKRANIRVDLPDREEELEALRDMIWLTWTREELVQRMIHGISQTAEAGLTVTCEPVETNFASVAASRKATGDIQIVHYKESFGGGAEQKKPRDGLFVVTWQETAAFEHSFPVASADAPHAPRAEGPAVVMCSATTMNESASLRPEVSGYVRIASPVVEGHILRRKPGGGTMWTACYSCPIDKHSFNGLTDQRLIVNEDGSPGPTVTNFIDTALALLEELKLGKSAAGSPARRRK